MTSARVRLRSAFLDLLTKKPIEKISVTALCQHTSLNRSTFYEYYYDIYDLLDDIQNEFLTRLDQLSLRIAEETLPPQDVIFEIQTFITANKKLLYLLLFQYKHPELEQRIHERLLRLFRQKVLQQYRVPASVSPEEFENLLLFLTAGFYSVYKRWILDDNSDSTLITKQLEQLSELCLMHTLQPRT